MSGWKKHEWNDVDGVYYNALHGPQLRLRQRKPFTVWAYGYGSREVRDVFLNKGKTFET